MRTVKKIIFLILTISGFSVFAQENISPGVTTSDRDAIQNLGYESYWVKVPDFGYC